VTAAGVMCAVPDKNGLPERCMASAERPLQQLQDFGTSVGAEADLCEAAHEDANLKSIRV
jgi:hypothetical protein